MEIPLLRGRYLIRADNINSQLVVVIDSLLSAHLGRALASFSHLLYWVGAMDRLTFVGVSFVLISAAIVACYVPSPVRHA